MIELPTLYGMRKDKKINSWTIRTEGDVVVMSYGVVGLKQAETRTRSTPTNTGRANARNGAQQAEFEAKAAWDKKKDEGYFETIAQAQSVKIYLPMLAQNAWVERKRKGSTVKELRPLKFPMSVQRKLNGLRCLATRDEMISRQGTKWNIPHIQEQVRQYIPKDGMLDGEIYIHGVPLQTLNSLIKVYKAESMALEFHVYDMPMEKASWKERKEALDAWYAQYLGTSFKAECEKNPGLKPPKFTFGGGLVIDPLTYQPTIRAVETIEVDSMEAIKLFEKVAVEYEGYEGLILRQHDRPYVWNTRCDSLLKLKQFTDMEFLIIGMKARELIKDGISTLICDKFVCRNNVNDKTFVVVPKGTEAQRAEYWLKREDFVGEQLMVRFLERSVDGIPQGNPVGLAVRIEGDCETAGEEDWTS